MYDLFVDLFRTGHMAAFAVGIGSAIFLEISVMQRCRNRIDADALDMLEIGHTIISAAVMALWLTGLGLLMIRTGLEAAPFTAKLTAKVAVVTILTANMFAIEHIALPRLRALKGLALTSVPPRTLAVLGAFAGLSAGTWTVALMLGGIGYFQSMDLISLAAVILPVLGISALAAAVTAVNIGAEERPQAIIRDM